MTWTKIRSTIAALLTIAFIFLLFCAGTVKMGWQIPGVYQVGQTIVGLIE